MEREKDDTSESSKDCFLEYKENILTVLAERKKEVQGRERVE